MRNSTQQARRNVCLSFHDFASLSEKMRSSADASLTWAKLQGVLLGGDRLGLRLKPLLLHVVLALGCSVEGWSGEMGYSHIKGQHSLGNAAFCLTPSGFGCRIVATSRDDCYRAFSHLLWFGLKDECLE